MYNGIGLQTARGSGTNGYVQRNLSSIFTTKDRAKYRTEEELQRLDADMQKKPNAEILEHIKKRATELKCAEMEDVMREEGYSEKEVQAKVSQYRAMLMEREKSSRLADNPLGSGRPNVRETHSVAEAQQQKNARLKEAFGISEYFVEGSSLDPDRKTKEEAARQAHLKQEDERRSRKHEWVSTPSPKGSPERKERKEKKKKKKRTRDRSSSHDSSKKRKSKKSKRSRSRSPKKKKREKKRKLKSKKTSRQSSRSTSSSRSPSPTSHRSSRSRRKDLKKVKSSSKVDVCNSKVKKNSKKPASLSQSKEKIEVKNSPEVPKRLDLAITPTMLELKDLPLAESKDQQSYHPKDAENDIKEKNSDSSSKKDVEHFAASSDPEKWKDSFHWIVKNKAVKSDSMSNSAMMSSGGLREENKKITNSKVDSKSSSALSKSLDVIGSKSGKSASIISGPNDKASNCSERLCLNGAEKPGEQLKQNFSRASKSQKVSALSKKLAISEEFVWSDRSSRSSSRTTKSRSWSRSSMSISPERQEPSNGSRRSRSSRGSKSRSRTKSNSHSPKNSNSRKWSHSRSKTRSRSASKSKIPSRSPSKSSSRSRSYGSSYSEIRSGSRTPKYASNSKYSGSSRSRSVSRSQSSGSRSRTRSLSKSRSRSGTRSSGSSKSRSPSIPRRKGSPSFLDKRRITSARKRPVPYHRPTPPPSPSSSSDSSYWWSNSPSRSRSWSRTKSPSYSR